MKNLRYAVVKVIDHDHDTDETTNRVMSIHTDLKHAVLRLKCEIAECQDQILSVLVIEPDSYRGLTEEETRIALDFSGLRSGSVRSRWPNSKKP